MGGTLWVAAIGQTVHSDMHHRAQDPCVLEALGGFASRETSRVVYAAKMMLPPTATQALVARAIFVEAIPFPSNESSLAKPKQDVGLEKQRARRKTDAA